MSECKDSPASSGNRLKNEKSPYLLLHAENPIDWYPWGPEAFEAATEQNKPIFLSIGYFACHWCHVMERESFADEEIGRLMNEAFISIKVDREERPDIDNLYMAVSQVLTGGGGWPLTIIMTPDQRPFFAGTYIPKKGRFGKMGMLDLIPRIQEGWAKERERIDDSANRITDVLKEISSATAGATPERDLLQTAFQEFQKRFDEENGGFGDAPKFPTPHNIMFLLRHWRTTGQEAALTMAQKTLSAMRMGGVYDHIGFGFHRYSTDKNWILPHFEKMLYDQALLTMAYVDAHLAAPKPEYETTIREVIAYVLRDLRSTEGAFYSAEDADSEEEEGLYYFWGEQELEKFFSAEDAALLKRVYHTEPDGNFEDQATRKKIGKNVLYLKNDAKTIAAELKISTQQLDDRLERLKKRLFEYREKRIRPLMDDKILVDWNGLMISALCRAAQALDEPEYTAAAERAAGFILEKMRKSDGELYHRYRDGETLVPANLDDYSFFIQALLDLYETTFAPKYLQAALEFNKTTLEKFWDEKGGGFYFTATDAERLLVRQKEIYDGAVPSGNSVAMLNLLRIGRMTSDAEMETRAQTLGKIFPDKSKQSPANFSQFMIALDFVFSSSYEIVFVGDPNTQEMRTLLRALRKKFIPNKVVLLRNTANSSSDITDSAPFIANQTAIDGKATVYVCQNYVCKFPTTDVNRMLELLDSK